MELPEEMDLMPEATKCGLLPLTILPAVAVGPGMLLKLPHQTTLQSQWEEPEMDSPWATTHHRDFSLLLPPSTVEVVPEVAEFRRAVGLALPVQEAAENHVTGVVFHSGEQTTPEAEVEAPVHLGRVMVRETADQGL